MCQILNATYVCQCLSRSLLLLHRKSQFEHCMLSGGDGMKICGPAKMDCVHQADGHLFRQGRLNGCDCLPPCSMLTYGALASQANFDLVSSYSYSAIQPEYDLEK